MQAYDRAVQGLHGELWLQSVVILYMIMDIDELIGDRTYAASYA